MTPLTYTVREAAEILGCSPNTVLRAIALGQLPSVRLSVRKVLVPRKAVHDYAAGKAAS